MNKTNTRVTAELCSCTCKLHFLLPSVPYIHLLVHLNQIKNTAQGCFLYPTGVVLGLLAKALTIGFVLLVCSSYLSGALGRVLARLAFLTGQPLADCLQ